MSPVFGHGHLRLYLLSLMQEQPRHGYELIQALSDRFGGTYSPSAGTIYPRLAKLEEEGMVSKTSDGRKTVYSITDRGREELAAKAEQLNSIEDNVTDSVRQLADSVRSGVAEAMRSLRADLASAARDARGEDTRAPGSRTATADSAPASPTAPADTHSATAPTVSEHAPWSGAPASEQQRKASNDALRDAEAALATFRATVRADLRKQSAKGTVSPEAVRVFTEDLRLLQAKLRTGLRA